uniref:Uncharacterized protein n=1 Tax=Pinguiococcus pyrenoidosus TaxID=172671 RepID=A0A6U0UBA7_9STRA|mmetsp:Transcript_14875/g.56371  ORF Transcript_14875/g.56371 Transcript_14875/m.56371 type:complete len:169 (+) Transcript_14875:294-800(+)
MSVEGERRTSESEEEARTDEESMDITTTDLLALVLPFAPPIHLSLRAGETVEQNTARADQGAQVVATARDELVRFQPAASGLPSDSVAAFRAMEGNRAEGGGPSPTDGRTDGLGPGGLTQGNGPVQANGQAQAPGPGGGNDRPPTGGPSQPESQNPSGRAEGQEPAER